jgi:hypothetical protein
MTLRAKLTVGLAFLFLIIFALVGFCSYCIGRLGQESDSILKDNYASLVYARNMVSALEDMKTSVTSTVYNTSRKGTTSEYYDRLFQSGNNVFQANLKAEKNNITEIHEKEYVERLMQDYDSYLKLCNRMRSRSNGNSDYFSEFLPAFGRLKQSVDSIYDVNMQAVVRKSRIAHHDSSRFMNSMAIIGSICLAFALFYFWYFPIYISTTMSYLAERMKKLVRSTGVTLETTTKDEAYLILHAINLLENKLGVKKEKG